MENQSSFKAVGRGGSYGAVGATCRDQAGMFLGASAVVFPKISYPATLEYLTIREAPTLADDLYERRIHVTSDCKVVVEDIHQKNPAVYAAIIHEIIHRKSFLIYVI